MPARAWTPANPNLAPELADARLQLHYAAQFATAAGISYLPAVPDDSHTNLGWNPELGALVSHPIPAPSPFCVGIRIADLTLLFTNAEQAVRATLALNGHTIADAAEWIGTQVAAAGSDSRRFTLKRHYQLPKHGVTRGARFDTGDAAAFEQLSAWFGNGASELGRLAVANPDAGAIRCWPHHFDIAMLIDLGGGRTIGAGLEPGDAYYAEPYFYVNMHPAPGAGALTIPLAGGGSWHTDEWIGAVLPGSRLVPAAAAQERQARDFLDSAVAAGRSLLLDG